MDFSVIVLEAMPILTLTKNISNYSGVRSRLGCRNPVSQRIDSNFI